MVCDFRKKKIEIYKVMMIAGIAVGLKFELIFLKIQNLFMSIYSIINIFVYAISLYFLIKKKRHEETLVIICFVAATIFVILSLYFFGWKHEFQNWLITLFAMSFLMPLGKKRTFQIIGVVEAILYPSCYLIQIFKDIPNLPMWVHKDMVFTNILIPFGMVMYISRILDITKAAEKYYIQKYNELKEIAEKDSLTGLFNRRKMQEILLEIDRKIKQEKGRYYAAFFDIDDFKKVNDTYGHDVGDIVIKEVAKTIKENLRKGDFVARWGGEDFLAIIKGNTKESMYNPIYEVLEYIRESVEQIRIKDYPQIRITITTGATDTNDKDIQTAIKKADDNLYVGKRTGKNKIVIDEGNF